jgi:hypothetical protein
MKSSRVLTGALAAAGFLGLAAPASAAILMTYTGNPYISIASSLAGSGITATVLVSDFDTSVDTNLNGSSFTLFNWTVSDGVTTLSKSHGDTLERADFYVAAGGDVTIWDLSASNALGTVIQTESAFEDTTVVVDPLAYSGKDQNQSFIPGSWTVASATPEPGVWAMMLMGLGGIGVRMRGARRKILAAA